MKAAEKDKFDLRPESEVPILSPKPSPHEPIGGRDRPEHVEGHPDGGVGDVIGEDLAGVGNGDAAAPALGEVDVVETGAGGDDDAEGREEVEEASGDPGGGGAEHGGGGLGVGGEEAGEGERGLPSPEDGEFGGERVPVVEEPWRVDDQELREVVTAHLCRPIGVVSDS